MKRPKMLAVPKLSILKKNCEAYLKEVERGDVDTDTRDFIFESAMEAIYGKAVWEYTKKIRLGHE